VDSDHTIKQYANSDTPFTLKWQFSCETRNLCYVLTCDGCGDNYIGQTERTVRERLGEYRRAINNKKFTQGVHQHISQCGKGIFSMVPFYKIRTFDRGHATILMHEECFIKKYNPELNRLKIEKKSIEKLTLMTSSDMND
jgi:predicted GIY-YIG superfamily endonuclease